MDKYLLEILREVNTIIIPGLGALTITNEDTGEIMFMPYLKHDDGKLSAYIASKEGMEENEAKNLIAKYVREIQAKLDQGESYDMFQFGSFFKKDDGDVDFRSWDSNVSANSSPDANKVVEEEIVSPEPEAPEQEEVISSESSINSNEVVEKAIDLTEQEEVVLPETHEEEVKQEIQETEKVLNIAEKEELDKNVRKLEKLKESKSAAKGERKKKGAGFWMMMVLIFLIVSGGTYFFIDYDNLKQHIPFLAENKTISEEPSELDKMKSTLGIEESGAENETAENETDIIQSDSEVEEVSESQPKEEVVSEPVKEEPVEKKKEVQYTPKTTTSGNYHIIAGAFSSPENAQKLAEGFQGQGYQVVIGMVNGLNMVSIGSFSTAQEAETALREMRSAAPKAWVYSGSL